MKKQIYLICVLILLVALIIGRYYDYKNNKAELNKFNLEYEEFTEKEIYGTQLATVINKAVDNNELNDVEKEYVKNNDNRYYFYVQNDTNSVNIDIKILDNNTTYKMESLYQGDITKFVQHYNSILFKCTKIDYNKAGRVSYMIFEQISK